MTKSTYCIRSLTKSDTNNSDSHKKSGTPRSDPEHDGHGRRASISSLKQKLVFAAFLRRHASAHVGKDIACNKKYFVPDKRSAAQTSKQVPLAKLEEARGNRVYPAAAATCGASNLTRVFFMKQTRRLRRKVCNSTRMLSYGNSLQHEFFC